MKLKSVLAASAASLCAVSAASAATIEEMVSQANAFLLSSGKNYRIEMAETLVKSDNGGAEMGQTILFSNRGNKQLSSDFVPGDSRRTDLWGDGTNITFALDDTQLTPDIAGTGELTEIRAAMATWENVQCSNIHLVDFGNTGVDVGVIQTLLDFGGAGLVAADVQHAGFLPPGFFSLLGSSNILGVTFTSIWVDGSTPTDIDNNGQDDVAFREIYYNDGFTWEVDPADQPGDGRFDLQTVALHEAGHGLSQGHFGALRVGTKNGKLHWSPLAVMNAGYVVGQQQLAGTDSGGHCSNWASWPNN